jgi:hypothetical protein
MLHAAILPARFRGVLEPSRLRPGEEDPKKYSRLRYWFEPLPVGAESKIDIVLDPAPGFLIDGFDEAAWHALKRIRSEAAGPGLARDPWHSTSLEAARQLNRV